MCDCSSYIERLKSLLSLDYTVKFYLAYGGYTSRKRPTVRIGTDYTAQGDTFEEAMDKAWERYSTKCRTLLADAIRLDSTCGGTTNGMDEVMMELSKALLGKQCQLTLTQYELANC